MHTNTLTSVSAPPLSCVKQPVKAVKQHRYNITIPPHKRVFGIEGDTLTNREPFCAELFSPSSLPYAFRSYPLEDKVGVSPCTIIISIINSMPVCLCVTSDEDPWLHAPYSAPVSISLLTYAHVL